MPYLNYCSNCTQTSA